MRFCSIKTRVNTVFSFSYRVLSLISVTADLIRGKYGKHVYFRKPRLAKFRFDKDVLCRVFRIGLANGTENYDGTYVNAAVNFSISPVSNKNTASYTLEYKLQTATTWTALTSGSVYALNSNIVSASGAFSVDSSYDLRLTVKDYFTTVTSIFEIPTAFTLMDFNASGKGVAFGKVSEKTQGMEIALDVEFMGKVTGTIFNAILPVGSMILRYDHTNPGTLYPGTTWVRVYGAFPWLTDANGQIGTTGGERNVTLTVDQIPAHSHGSVYSQHAPGTKGQAWYTTAGTSLAYGAIETGGGQAHNNMPPYIQISAWRRTA